VKLQIEKNGEVNVLRLAGRMTIEQGGGVQLRDRVGVLVDEGERRFILDMSGVDYLDSAAIGSVVACYKRATAFGGMVKIVLTPDNPLRQVFALTHLDQVFEIYGDDHEALAGFTSGPCPR